MFTAILLVVRIIEIHWLLHASAVKECSFIILESHIQQYIIKAMKTNTSI